MVTDQEIEREFEEFSVTIDDLSVLDKLKEICILCHLSATELVEEWIAHVTSAGCNQEPDLSSLEDFERKQSLSKEKKQKQLSIKLEETKPLMFSKDTIDEVISEEYEDLLECYQTPGNKLSTKRPHTTPEAAINKRHASLGRSPGPAPFSPASFSPASATPSIKYSSRNNSGEIVFSFNPSGSDPQHIIQQHIPATHLTVQYATQKDALLNSYKYMFQKQGDKATVLGELIDNMAEKLQASLGVEEFSSLCIPTQEEVFVIGRICCDSNGKLNSQSVVLEGSQELSSGQQIKLDLSELRQFALFPGQVVAIEGVNSTGQKLVVNKLCTGVQLPFHSPVENVEHGSEDITSEPFLMSVAAGPFTTSDSLLYEPLADLMQKVQNDKPNLLILLGPFVDTKHDQIINGDLEEPFEDLFDRQVQQIVKATEKLATTVVFVPSHRDVHHDFVYPQPPFSTKVNTAEFNAAERIHFVSDPCTLVVNNVSVGLSSMDVLLHLASEETVCPPGSSDRFGRLLKHILHQHSYYPLHPPAEDVNIDYEQFEKYAMLPYNPDILILPSDLRYFAKDTLGCLCLNPGRLAKGHVGGTYAKVWVKSSPDHLDKSSSHILQRSLAQVIRI
ncbi:DNA polymerase alpha subunit B-like isoform X1 [Orbicella faveolata]|uniref:DNA polymerase alpha subunit B-like isoform X1 n=2 Tax=Orbicella faveolata TaxID=48498 RepID=UPI0009E1AEF1|nr:DNA polymerase alpha subunit B-like isoform X1 [Orbicella faveolata]